MSDVRRAGVLAWNTWLQLTVGVVFRTKPAVAAARLTRYAFRVLATRGLRIFLSRSPVGRLNSVGGFAIGEMRSDPVAKGFDLGDDEGGHVVRSSTHACSVGSTAGGSGGGAVGGGTQIASRLPASAAAQCR